MQIFCIIFMPFYGLFYGYKFNCRKFSMMRLIDCIPLAAFVGSTFCATNRCSNMYIISPPIQNNIIGFETKSGKKIFFRPEKIFQTLCCNFTSSSPFAGFLDINLCRFFTRRLWNRPNSGVLHVQSVADQKTLKPRKCDYSGSKDFLQ